MPKILWMSPYSLHDITSGASIHCRAILESLLPHGFEVWSFASFVFDRPQGGAATFGDLNQLFARDPHAQLIQFDDRGIHYIYLKNQHTKEMERTVSEQNEYFERYLEVLHKFQPDIVIGYGTGMDSYTCFAEAQRRGIATVYLLLNGKHAHFTFPHLDLVLTDSHTTAQLYAEREHINCTPIGQFIEPKYVVAATRTPTFVTMVNPDLSKGLALFAKLVHTCKTALPDVKFLVVNSRANFVAGLPYLHEQGSKVHPYQASDFDNVLMANATNDMRLVYERSKVVIVPSLAYESWGRIASEALLNDIPVLGSKIGGIPEAINGGGIVLEPPAACVQDYTALPSDAEIAPWVDSLKRLLQEDWSQAIATARTNVDLTTLSTRLASMLTTLCARRIAAPETSYDGAAPRR
ncbi:MAG TPA: glycosyltransferase [Candidatus Anaerobiospirillum stercoravium]|nr:glycosyltransferase [Candidatus Anaerobiospirillum stercoravium]